MEPLDEEEGPTIWIEQDDHNGYVYQIVVGSDPDNPLQRVELSAEEIRRASTYVDQTQ